MDNPINPFGLKDSVILAGAMGGFLRALSTKHSTFREVVASPICGAIAAAYLTEPIVHYMRAINLPLPPSDGTNTALNAAAFVVGICGMWCSDFIIGWIEKKISGSCKKKKD